MGGEITRSCFGPLAWHCWPLLVDAVTTPSEPQKLLLTHKYVYNKRDNKHLGA